MITFRNQNIMHEGWSEIKEMQNDSLQTNDQAREMVRPGEHTSKQIVNHLKDKSTP